MEDIFGKSGQIFGEDDFCLIKVDEIKILADNEVMLCMFFFISTDLSRPW